MQEALHLFQDIHWLMYATVQFTVIKSFNGITSCSELIVLYLISLFLKILMSKSTGKVKVSQRCRVSRSSVKAANKSGVGSVRSSTWDFLLNSLTVLFGFGHNSDNSNSKQLETFQLAESIQIITYQHKSNTQHRGSQDMRSTPCNMCSFLTHTCTIVLAYIYWQY